MDGVGRDVGFVVGDVITVDFCLYSGFRFVLAFFLLC